MALKIKAKAAEAGETLKKALASLQHQEQVEAPTPSPKADVFKPVVVEKSILTAEEQQAVDRMLEISQVLAPYLPLLKEQEQLKKQLCSVALERFDPLQPAVLKGKSGIVEFDTETRNREVTDKEGLINTLKEKVGYEALFPLITVPLKVVDTYLSESEAMPFLGLEENGKRKLVSVRPRKE